MPAEQPQKPVVRVTTNDHTIRVEFPRGGGSVMFCQSALLLLHLEEQLRELLAEYGGFDLECSEDVRQAMQARGLPL